MKLKLRFLLRLLILKMHISVKYKMRSSAVLYQRPAVFTKIFRNVRRSPAVVKRWNMDGLKLARFPKL